MSSDILACVFLFLIAGIICLWVNVASRADDNYRAFRHGSEAATRGEPRGTVFIARTQNSYDHGYTFGARMLGRADGLLPYAVHYRTFADDKEALQAYDKGYQDSLEDLRNGAVASELLAELSS